jgi:hypothetical protein
MPMRCGAIEQPDNWPGVRPGRYREVSLMPSWAGVLHACIAGGVIYAAVVAVAALVAIFARTPARRRAAREVLQILLFSSKKAR